MRLGYVRKVTTSGERTLLTVAIDRELYPDVVLLHPLRVRQQVNEGDRVRVMQEGQNADALYAELVEVAGPVTPMLDFVGNEIWLRSPDGTARALAFKDEVETLRDQFVGHVHATAGTGSPSPAARPGAPPTVITAADVPVVGTQHVKGE